MNKIELLAPAKNKECGIEAIIHGADAVYIGAPKFGARAAANNSIVDIAELISFAHQFDAKVYVALNTIIKDEELEEVEKLIHQLYAINTDAIIIQDMGILELNLPPICIHASTQSDIRTLEKVQFLESVGFDQVVLARELSLQQIKHIAQNSSCNIEVFVHGSLCVSYSGQCYISQAQLNRSANRGECAQLCRLPYDLLDNDNNVIESNKHLLSLKDLNLSDYIEDLILAGVSSFKIEGRLKDVEYVKNITAYYRKKIDDVLNKYPTYKKTSSGDTFIAFEPDPQKTFQRQQTQYFIHKPTKELFSWISPKSFGEKIAIVKKTTKDTIEIDALSAINNGDGLCFVSPKEILEGFRVNKIIDNIIFLNNVPPTLSKGTILYRNANHQFIKVLDKKSAQRKIPITINIFEKDNAFLIEFIDDKGNTAEKTIYCTNDIANNSQEENIEKQLSKLGNTIFYCKKINIHITENHFLPSSSLTEVKRELADILLHNRISNYKTKKNNYNLSPIDYPKKTIDYTGNVANHLAAQFYQKHGVTTIEYAFEIQKALPNPILMFCKACIKDTMGYCTKKNKQFPYKEPLFLRHKKDLFQLTFDCDKCEMLVFRKKD